MHNLNDAVEIVEPAFDYPTNRDAASASLSVGSRVSLIYRGKPLPVRVEAIERLGTSFVGRVRGAQGNLPLVRFRLKDVASVD
jgi:hypothetical protein